MEMNIGKKILFLAMVGIFILTSVMAASATEFTGEWYCAKLDKICMDGYEETTETCEGTFFFVPFTGKKCYEIAPEPEPVCQNGVREGDEE